MTFSVKIKFLLLLTGINLIQTHGSPSICAKNITVSCLVDTPSAAKVYYDECNIDNSIPTCCPPRKTIKTTLCTEDKINPSYNQRYCTNCTLVNGNCKKNSDCCYSYFSIAPEFKNREIRVGSKCFEEKCKACLPPLTPCKGNRLSCCNNLGDSKTSYACRRGTWYDEYRAQTYDACTPDACAKNELNSAMPFHLYKARCFATKDFPDYPIQYNGTNFCKCPEGPLAGFKCLNMKCVPCGLENAMCSNDSDCCAYHSCKNSHCTQNSCALYGSSCKEKECCGGLSCLRKFKTCTTAICREDKSPCRASYECCEPLVCARPRNGTLTCQKHPNSAKSKFIIKERHVTFVQTFESRNSPWFIDDRDA